jgi:phage terminase large subunit GpA-like protein
MNDATTTGPTLSLVRRLADQVRIPQLRPMRLFAEQEIVIPTGPFAGRKYRGDRQPYSGLWFGALDSGRWRRNVATGPQQSGKSFHCFVIPTLYHLFEVGETVLCGLPSLDLVKDKWEEDLLPAIEASSRFRELLPRRGEGSRGGNVESRVQFQNGATLRFMTGGGGDKARAGFTSRVLVVTETDGMDEAGGGSREADKITQLEGRTRAFGDRARIYMECTVSHEAGRTWQEYTKGTQSRIALRCPHCRAYVTPEREHLVGWRDAPSDAAAAAAARVACPGCGATWDEPQRLAANADAVLVHRGQEPDETGALSGTPPATDTFGFRWTAVNNLLVGLGVVAKDEWKASRAVDEENADKAMRQFVWALPSEAGTVDLNQLDAQVIAQRVTEDPPKRVPSGAELVSVGVDVGKHLCHWVAVAWRPDGSPHLIEYGRLEVPSAELAEERALLAALRQFRDEVCAAGWESDVGELTPALTLVDSGWQTDVVYAFCRESGAGWHPAKGFGHSRYERGRIYKPPRSKDRAIAFVGEGYHVARLTAKRTRLFDVNADAWKSRLHDGLRTPVGAAGAVTLYKAEAARHLTLGKHLTAEKQVRDFLPGVGEVTRWEALHRNNHLLDACCLALVAGTHARAIAPRAGAPRAAAAAGGGTGAAAGSTAKEGWFKSRRKVRQRGGGDEPAEPDQS